MMGDNYSHVRDHLNKVRRRQPKFICLNDDMNKTAEPDPRYWGRLLSVPWQSTSLSQAATDAQRLLRIVRPGDVAVRTTSQPLPYRFVPVRPTYLQHSNVRHLTRSQGRPAGGPPRGRVELLVWSASGAGRDWSRDSSLDEGERPHA